MRSMHSSSKSTWRARTSAAERGSVIGGSGRTGHHRPATATGGHIRDTVSPSRTGRSPFRPPQQQACLDGLGRNPASTTWAGPASRFTDRPLAAQTQPGPTAMLIISAQPTGEGRASPMADQPRQHRESLAQIESRSIDHIPPEERHGRIRDQFTLWFGLNANIFPVVLGGVVVFMGLDFLWACVAIALGVVIGLVLVGFHAIQGPKLGVPQMIQSRGQFGFYGAVLVFAASIVLDFGFLAAQLVIQADAMNLLVSAISIPGWIAILTVPVVVLTIYGYDWIHLFQRWMTVILGVTFVIVFIQAILHGGLAGAAASTHAPSFAVFMRATGIFVIAMVSWAPYVSDYSRYLPETISKPKTFWGVVGALGCRWALPVMAVSLIGSDVANAYTGMLAVVSIASCVKNVQRSVWVRVIASLLVIAAGTGCALLGYKQFVNNLSNFLNVLLYVFIPWSAINLTDYYLVRHGNYDVASFFTPHGRYGGF